MSSDEDAVGTARDEEFPTIAPEKEPEYVGAHSARATPDCRNWKEPKPDGQCGNESTHTVVMFHDGELSEIAMCDNCGNPEDVDGHQRRWSGDVV